MPPASNQRSLRVPRQDGRIERGIQHMTMSYLIENIRAANPVGGNFITGQ